MLSRSASGLFYQAPAMRLFLLQLAGRLCMVSHQFQRRLRMNYTLIPKELRPIAEKIEASSRNHGSSYGRLFASNLEERLVSRPVTWIARSRSESAHQSLYCD